MLARAQYFLLGALLLIAVLSAFSASYNPYFLDIAVTCGINITLAVSLNLINGYTGQFSLGHAGFMGVGAYAAAVLTTTFGAALLSVLGGQEWLLFARHAREQRRQRLADVGQRRAHSRSTTISERTEFAMKQFSCARSCRCASSSADGAAPAKTTFGRSTTFVIASLPSAFFSMKPVAASS